MKQKKYSLFYYISVFLAGLFFFFLSDLAYFGRIAKNEDIWWNVCVHLDGHKADVCMARYDLLCIFIILGLLMWLGYILAPIYKKKIFFIPLLGLLIYPICNILYYLILRLVQMMVTGKDLIIHVNAKTETRNNNLSWYKSSVFVRVIYRLL